MRRNLDLLSSLLFLFALTAGDVGCGGAGTGGSGGSDIGGGGGGGDGGSRADVGSVIVGVTSDLRPGVDFDRLHVRKWVSGALSSDEQIGSSAGGLPLALPAEFPFRDLGDGEDVAIQIDAFSGGDADAPLVSRFASTQVIAGKEVLLRVPIDSRCAVAPGTSAPICAAPATCIAGECGSSAVSPKGLPPYDASWSAGKGDTCKPTGGGTPTVIVGEGQSDYLPTQDLDIAQVEAGPQGGHHIWVAVRMKNLLKAGSITRVSGNVPELGLDIEPFQVIFTFDQDEGGFCKLYGLRFQVDQSRKVQDLLGKVLTVKVQVTDKDGDVGVGERTVTLSKTSL